MMSAIPDIDKGYLCDLTIRVIEIYIINNHEDRQVDSITSVEIDD